MPTLRFHGFPPSEPVAISASQGNAVVSAGIPEWGTENGLATAAIYATRSTAHVAPEIVHFEVRVDGFDLSHPSDGSVYDPAFHGLFYLWDYDDPDASFDAPANLLPTSRDASLGYGPIGAHCYATPGTYRPSVLVIEPSTGRRAYAAVEIVVEDPNTVFAGNRTFYVHPLSDFTQAPAGAREYSSLTAAISDAAAVSDGFGAQLPRVMLARNHQYTVSSLPLFNVDAGMYICAAPGSGDRPVIDHDGSGILTTINGDEWTFANLDVRGVWNSTAQTGASRFGIFMGSDHAVQYLHVHGCRFDGLGVPIYPSGRGTASSFFLGCSDTIITNWREYGVLGSAGSHTAFLGCEIAHDPDALCGFPSNMQGPIRFSDCASVAIDGCDLFSRTGWFVNVPSIHTGQPCLRWNTTGAEGARGNIQRCTMEGGFVVVSFSRTNPGQEGRVQNLIMEKSYILGSHMTSDVISTHYAGLTLRNNVLVRPATSSINSVFDPRRFVSLSNQGLNADNTAAPIRAYHNTFVNLMDGTLAASGTGEMVVYNTGTSFTDVVFSDNVVHQPNLNAPQNADAPLDATTLFAPRYKAYEDSDTPPIAGTETPPDSAGVYAPMFGSDALGDATGALEVLDDLRSVPRPINPSRGASEVSL